MPILHASDLARYVADADAAPGGFADPMVVARYEPLELQFDTIVDQTLSPYSDIYFEQQMSLYREVSGRILDQESGELHGDDLSRLLNAPNPTGISEPNTVAEYVRCVSTMLGLCCLGGQPNVLDLGAGHGLGSEVMAYTGCNVHAVDIDPGLGQLSRARAAPRDLGITRTEMNFDDVSRLENGHYDAALFFQALHHCLRPWQLVADLKAKLGVDGVIAFAGEPIQDIWWKNWGLRLDPVSLYVARARGWFESGWSYAFIRDCFERNGFHLTFFTGGFRGGEIGVATLSEEKRLEVIEYAGQLGFKETRHRDELDVTDSDFVSTAGAKTMLSGRPAFKQVTDDKQALVYGPYMRAEAGRYEISMLVKQDRPYSQALFAGRLRIDVSYESGQHSLFRTTIGGWWKNRKTRILVYQLYLPKGVNRLEIRAFAGRRARWVVSVPTIRKIRV